MPTVDKKNPSSLADRDPAPIVESTPEYEYHKLPNPTAIVWLNSQGEPIQANALAINQKGRLRLGSGESVPLERVIQWGDWNKDDRVWSSIHQCWGEIRGFDVDAAKVELGNAGIVTIPCSRLFRREVIPAFSSKQPEQKERKEPDICKAFPIGTAIKDAKGNGGTVTKHLTATRIEIAWEKSGNPWHYNWDDIRQLGIRKVRSKTRKAMKTADIVPVGDLETEIDRIYRDLTETEQTAIAAAKATVEHYRLLGEKLAIQKKQLGHGNWLPWLKEHGIDENRAKRAIKIAAPESQEKLKAIAAANQSAVTDFTLTEVLGYLYKKTPPEEIAQSPEGRTFEEVQELFKPWGNFECNPMSGAYKYILTGCRGGDRFFKGLDSAARWHEEYCREDNRLDAPDRPKSESPVTGVAPFAPQAQAAGNGERGTGVDTQHSTPEPGEIRSELDEAVTPSSPDKSAHARQIMTSSKTDEHYTPQEVLECVYACFAPLGGVQLDPCSNAIGEDANVIAEAYFTIAQDGLAQDWLADTVYINPPYSDVAAWVEKAVKAYDAGSAKEILLLVKADPSTQWFQKVWFNATAVCFVNHRLRFINDSNDGNGATFPSAIAYFGSEIDRFYHAFESLGAIVQVINPELFGE